MTFMTSAYAAEDSQSVEDASPAVAAQRAAPGMTDFCTRDGAQVLKQRIEAYWKERGFDVSIILHNVGFHPAIRAARYELRSDLQNGWPRAKRAPAPIPHANDDLTTEDRYADEA